jgi:sulfatase maturation enzyme AslB (radical SAM superfamily)
LTTTSRVDQATHGQIRRAEKIHDFTAKLRQPGVLGLVVDYLKWQRALRKAREEGREDPETPSLTPISINLDVTTACNYKCDHCIDWDILNSPVKHAEEELRNSLRVMAKTGLKSVILIGGGEPTLYPGFPDLVRFMKEELRLQVSVVSNGSKNKKILRIARYLEPGDWVRLSLDSARNQTFQRMHNPSPRTLTLDEICSWVPKIKAANPDFDFGYSFIITWKGAQRDDVKVVENIGEIVEAAHRARDAGFNYISYKPFLERAEDGAEIMDPEKAEADMRATVARIRELVDTAKQLERPGFRVMESTNLRMLEQNSWRALTAQPKTCHMQALRQVLTPLGTFNCPAYRGVEHARLGEKNAYRDFVAAKKTAEETKGLLDNFDASHNCQEVTCLYNKTNWWMEQLIDADTDLDALQPSEERNDYFL